jgi:hypothetical protein
VAFDIAEMLEKAGDSDDFDKPEVDASLTPDDKPDANQLMKVN